MSDTRSSPYYWETVRRENSGSTVGSEPLADVMKRLDALHAAPERFERSGQAYGQSIGDMLGKERPASADSKQYGGSHYKEMGVQPWSVMQAVLTYDEFVGYLKGNIIKYGMRQGLKTEGDAAKAQHYIDKLQEVEGGRLGY